MTVVGQPSLRKCIPLILKGSWGVEVFVGPVPGLIILTFCFKGRYCAMREATLLDTSLYIGVDCIYCIGIQQAELRSCEPLSSSVVAAP